MTRAESAEAPDYVTVYVTKEGEATNLCGDTHPRGVRYVKAPKADDSKPCPACSAPIPKGLNGCPTCFRRPHAPEEDPFVCLRFGMEKADGGAEGPDALGLYHDRPIKASGVSRPAKSVKVGGAEGAALSEECPLRCTRGVLETDPPVIGMTATCPYCRLRARERRLVALLRRARQAINEEAFPELDEELRAALEGP